MAITTKRITMRQGSSADWEANKTKILSGELAIVNDTGEAYFAPKDGSPKRFATEDDVKRLSEQKVDNPSTGAVGQILEIETVDENGKPKTYKAVDKPEGGGDVEGIGGVEITDADPEHESTVLTVNPEAEEKVFYTADEVDAEIKRVEDTPVSWNDLKDRPFYVGEKKYTEIYADTVDNFEDFSDSAGYTLYTGYGFSPSLEVNTETAYRVTFDGVVYDNLHFYEQEGMPVLGSPTFDDYPFSLGVIYDEDEFFEEHRYRLVCGTNISGTSHTISISEVIEEFKQLDEKFIPDTIARVSDLENIHDEIYDDINRKPGYKVTGTTYVIDNEEIIAKDGAEIFNRNNVAIGTDSHAEGYYTTASGNSSHAEGTGTKASGSYSHAEGYYTKAFGNYSHAEGDGTTASGNYSHAEGDGTTASGNYSHAEGNGTKASGRSSHGEGNGTTASGWGSHAEGSGTVASSSYSHAEGYATTASGNSSHAEGTGTKASGSYSHAEGYYTKALGNYQHVQGKYNIDDVDADGNRLNKYAHIVGNGKSDTERSNAHTIDWDGLGWFAGGLKVGGTGQDDEVAQEVALKNDISWYDLKDRPFYRDETLTEIFSGVIEGFGHPSSGESIFSSTVEIGDIDIDINKKYRICMIVDGNSRDPVDVEFDLIPGDVNIYNSKEFSKHGFQVSIATAFTGNSLTLILNEQPTVVHLTLQLVRCDIQEIPKELLPQSVVLPTVTTADNGKVLQVVDGVWAPVEPITYEDGNEVEY